ncbi:MAG: SUMF1/EgtB/PvdO family nonheme iron enzyme, partial [Bacteroidota bacterium]
LLANFKPGPSNYGECGYKFASPVDAFPSNGYGLYDMAGNGREFVKYGGEETTELDDGRDTLAAVETMGGSCLKIAWFMQPGVREKVSSRRYKPCDAGFRCVMPHIGEAPAQ